MITGAGGQAIRLLATTLPGQRLSRGRPGIPSSQIALAPG